MLANLARAIEAATPDAHVMILLVDERPEEITGLGELTNGEVIASSFERPPEEHTHVLELTLERAKRLVELGNDVVILVDGITRLVRAYSAVGQPSGRTLPGGIDAAALFPPKRFLGAAKPVRGWLADDPGHAALRHRRRGRRVGVGGVCGYREHGGAPRSTCRRLAGVPRA